MATEINQERYEQALHLARLHTPGSQPGVVTRGSANRPAVKALQDKLSQLGYAVSTDGVFGDETATALKKFQKDHGAKVDARVGEETLGKLLRAKAKKSNPADPGIDAIQQVVAPGQATTGAGAAGRGLGNLRALQHGGGAAATKAPTGPHGGAIDKATGAEIASSKTGPIGSTTPHQPSTYSWEQGKPGQPPAGDQQPTNPEFEKLHPREGGKFASKGSEGPEVANAQTALNHAAKPGEQALKTDGLFGPKTDAAVRGFQERRGLKVDGIVGPKTSASLRRAADQARHRAVRTGQAQP